MTMQETATATQIRFASKQNPFVFYIRTFFYAIIALVLRLIALLPLAAWFVFPAGSPWRWLALLCPLMLILLVLPLRFSFAQALVQQRRERHFSFDKAFGLGSYGEKLSEGLIQTLHLLAWSVPLIAMAVGGYFSDAFSLLAGIVEIGEGATTVVNAVANFFIGIFGGQPLTTTGGLMQGVYCLCALVGLGVLILLFGMMRNSSYRYIWVVASDEERNPRTEARRRLRGRRWRQLGVAMVNLALWLPALLVVALTLKDVVSELSQNISLMLMQRKLLLPDAAKTLKPLLFAFFALYLPLLPIRRILTCAFATRAARHFPKKTDGIPVAGGIVGIPTTSSGAPSFEGEQSVNVEPSEAAQAAAQVGSDGASTFTLEP